MLSESSFELQPGSRTSFGCGAIKKLGKRIKALGRTSAFLITDPGVVKAGVAERVTSALDAERISWGLFEGVTANPTASSVEQGAAALREHPEAVVIAVGGGSSLDAAKAIALMAPNSGKLADFHFGCRPAHPAHPLAMIPTTAGTGSETNIFGVVTDPALGRKVLVAHPSLQPAVIVLDPELTVGVPPGVTATCGMDVLTHAVEAFTSNRSNPFGDAVALQAIRMLGVWLPRAYEDGRDVEARSQMLLAAHLAGIAFTNSGLGICHAMGHPLSARLDAAHGQTLATLLPHVMRYNRELCEHKYAEVARALGVSEPEANDSRNTDLAIDAVERLRARVRADRGAGELGVTRELIPTLVEDAFADVLMMATPKYPKPEDVAELYARAL